MTGYFLHGKFLNGQRSETYSDGSMYVYISYHSRTSLLRKEPTVNRYQETFRDGVWDGGEGIQTFTNGDTLVGVFTTLSGEFTYNFFNGGKYVPTEVPLP